MKAAGESLCVGIDLGVGCVVASAVAAPSGQGRPIVVGTNETGGCWTPAAISFDGKLRHVGLAAQNRQLRAPQQTFTYLPLLLGQRDATRARAASYGWLSPVEADGGLGPVEFNGASDLIASPRGALSALFCTLASYVMPIGGASGASGVLDAQSIGHLCLAVPDFFSDDEVAAARDALDISGLAKAGTVTIIRHSDGLATSFSRGLLADAKVAPQTKDIERTVGFVDIGVTHATVFVVRFVSSSEGEVAAHFIFRNSIEGLGVHAFVRALLSIVIPKIEETHRCKVAMFSRSGLRLLVEAERVLKQLSMLSDATFDVESFQPEGSGRELDISFVVHRADLEAAASSTLEGLKALVVDALAAAPMGCVEGLELVGGGSRIPVVQSLLEEASMGVPLRFGLDSCASVAVGAAAWASGCRVVPALLATSLGPSSETIIKLRAQEDSITSVHSAEILRLTEVNDLETYLYQVRDWMSGEQGSLLKPEVIAPRLDEVAQMLEEGAYGDETLSLEVLRAKLKETKEFVQKHGCAFFEDMEKKRLFEERALAQATLAERRRRRELGLDVDKAQLREWQKTGQMPLSRGRDESYESPQVPWLNKLFGQYRYDKNKDLARTERLKAMANEAPQKQGCCTCCFDFLMPSTAAKRFNEKLPSVSSTVHSQPAPEGSLFFLGGVSLAVPSWQEDLADSFFDALGCGRSRLGRVGELRFDCGASHLWNPMVSRSTGVKVQEAQRWPGQIRLLCEDIMLLNDKLNYIGGLAGDCVESMQKGTGEAAIELLVKDPWAVNRYYCSEAPADVAERLRALRPRLVTLPRKGRVKENALALVELLYLLPRDGSLAVIAKFYRHFFQAVVTEEAGSCYVHFSPASCLHQTLTFREGDPSETLPVREPNEICIYVRNHQELHFVYAKCIVKGLVLGARDQGTWEAVARDGEFRVRGCVDPADPTGRMAANLHHLVRSAAHEECPYPNV